jgi:hypothetical protein
MSFRKVGGVQYSATQNVIKSRYNVSDNLYVNKYVGEPNTVIDFLSDISGNITIYGDLDVSGNVHVSGDIDCSGNLYTGKDAYINSVRVGRGEGNIGTNTVVGFEALNANTVGYENTALGYRALRLNKSNDNTAVGLNALRETTDGSFNTAVGSQSLYANTNGKNNTAIGYLSGVKNLGTFIGPTNCNYCTFIGNNTSTDNNFGYNYSTAIGSDAQINASNQIVLGTSNEKIKIPGSYVGIGGVYNPSGLNNYNVDLSGNLQIVGNLPNTDNTKSQSSLRIVTTSAGTQPGVLNSSIITYLNGYELGYAATRGVGGSGVNPFMGIYPDSLDNGNYNSLVKQGDHVILWGKYPFYQSGSSGPVNSVTEGFVICPWQLSSSNGLRMDASGNVGIGKSTPSFTLDVSGNFGTTMDASINSITVGRGGGNVDSNTAVGFEALSSNTTGINNIAVGYQTLKDNNNSGNVAIGWKALYSNQSGFNNTAIGGIALSDNISGNDNFALGISALGSNISGSANVAIGVNAAAFNNTGSTNIAIGSTALFINQFGSNNIAIGYEALFNTDSSYNVAVGLDAGRTNNTGINNTYIGCQANCTGGSFSNSTAIGNGASVTASNQVRIGNNAVTSIGGFANFTNVSDKRDKKNIKLLDAGLNFINVLKPVRFVWNVRNNGKKDIPEVGFIAQDLLQAQKDTGVNIPGLVHDEDPEQLFMTSSCIIPILVKAVQEMSSTITRLEGEINELKSKLA